MLLIIPVAFKTNLVEVTQVFTQFFFMVLVTDSQDFYIIYSGNALENPADHRSGF